jgi:hypothetical protein
MSSARIFPDYSGCEALTWLSRSGESTSMNYDFSSSTAPPSVEIEPARGAGPFEVGLM